MGVCRVRRRHASVSLLLRWRVSPGKATERNNPDILMPLLKGILKYWGNTSQPSQMDLFFVFK